MNYKKIDNFQFSCGRVITSPRTVLPLNFLSVYCYYSFAIKNLKLKFAKHKHTLHSAFDKTLRKLIIKSYTIKPSIIQVELKFSTL